jgi:hypothetical protein
MLLDFMYVTRESDSLGAEYQSPKNVTREQWREWVKVASFKGDGDGQDCELYELRMPARFYKLIVLPGLNSIGELQPGYEVITGSGLQMGILLMWIAREVARGMIGFRLADKEKENEQTGKS